ncbi:hypothetical protein KDH83_11005 [Achromobacter sp. Marseille-Q0513]|uniref:AfsA-related hotdog domain-containing protein n=1 Tax=Achromobacter sp. Marseille-Q0513 TaxID=2829161 RepID=UPI001B9F7705|nr:AfsA-related hotdog domain-containing protein [Achromobacter sp. Marseille-Q0513]MBR8653831.1 hypothetical protein [Achromobacter sp. Marseille-Q0513]
MPIALPALTSNLLHKSSADDVLIENPNLLIPATLPTGRLSVDGVDKLISTGFYKLSEDDQAILSSTLDSISHIDNFCSAGLVNTLERHAGSEKTAISQILKSTEVSIPFAISFNAINNTDHYYFYQKEHEHVPGTMLIEIARQAMYYYTYASYCHQRGKVTISISTLDVVFDGYTESSYPLQVIATQANGNYESAPKHLDLIAEFFQRGKRVGQIRLKGGVMREAVFKKLRRFEPPAQCIFQPFPHLAHRVLLDSGSGQIVTGVLESISLSSLTIKAPGSTDAITRILILLPDEPCLVLPVTVQRIEEEMIVLETGEFSTEAEAALKSYIKRYCKYMHGPSH